MLTTPTCYMCDASPTSKEHAPPLCFFPKEKEIFITDFSVVYTIQGVEYRKQCAGFGFSSKAGSWFLREKDKNYAFDAKRAPINVQLLFPISRKVNKVSLLYKGQIVLKSIIIDQEKRDLVFL